jgi:hypothetical protein
MPEDGPMVATPVVPLLQEPPAGVAVSVVVVPAQTEEDVLPVIATGTQEPGEIVTYPPPDS